MRSMSGGVLAALCLSLTVIAAQADPPLRITVAGGAVRGADSVVGEAVGVLVRREYPNAAYTYEPGNVAGNLVRLANRTHAFATSGPVEIQAAQRGEPPFFAPVDTSGFRVVARIADGVLLYFVARQDFLDRYAIRSVADFGNPGVKLRIAIGRAGTPSVQRQALAYLAEYRITRDSIEAQGGEVFDFAMPQAIEMLHNGQLDVAFTGGHYPEARLLELSRATPIRFVPIGPQTLIERVARSVGADQGVIPAGAYEFLDRDYPTTTMALFLVAGPSAEDATVAALARALHRQFAYMAKVHPMYRTLGPEILARSGSLPLHPQAERYYRQVGLLPAAVAR